MLEAYAKAKAAAKTGKHPPPPRGSPGVDDVDEFARNRAAKAAGGMLSAALWATHGGDGKQGQKTF